MEKLRVGIVSLGCDKNRIDSELILGNLSDEYIITNDPKKAEIIIVNTCGFIESSKQESINTILEMSKYKKEHNCNVLIVTGCLSQRYKNELQELIPEIDIMLGVNDYNKLKESIKAYLNNSHKISYYNYSNFNINEGKRIISTGKYTAYLRIAEGCSNFCSYCIIPKIRGKYRSRKIENIVEEAKLLAENGVKEIILVAQDTTKYGVDLYDKKMLPKLLHEISKIDTIKWIRILYCYPEEITDELIKEISKNPKVCKYLDIPIQHISDNVLKAMRRKSSKKQIVDIINKLRSEVEDIAIRTSIIVGFPGETEEDFKELKENIKDIKFDNLGVFKYSKEEDTLAYSMLGHIDEDIKEHRYNELMEIQQKISQDINAKKIGKVYNVIVEGFSDDMWCGRNYEMSPEVDGLIYFTTEKEVKIGDIVKVKIIKSLQYDLIGVV